MIVSVNHSLRGNITEMIRPALDYIEREKNPGILRKWGNKNRQFAKSAGGVGLADKALKIADDLANHSLHRIVHETLTPPPKSPTLLSEALDKAIADINSKPQSDARFDILERKFKPAQELLNKGGKLKDVKKPVVAAAFESAEKLVHDTIKRTVKHVPLLDKFKLSSELHSPAARKPGRGWPSPG